MDWIEPLAMESWILNVFSGNADIFLAIALIVIMGLSAYFRMGGLTLMFIVGLFFMMFSEWINVEIYFIIIAVASVLIGFWISKVVR